MLSLLHTIDTKNNKRQENSNSSNSHHQIQDIKDVQHKNINMTWYYRKFPRHSFSAEKFETRGRNTIILYYNYRIYPELGKVVCEIHRIACTCPA